MWFTTKLTFFTAFIASILLPHSLWSTETSPLIGIEDDRPGLIAFENANIVKKPGETIEKGTLLIKNEEIINAGKNISIPNHARTVDLKGKWIYPSFVELEKQYGIEDNEPTEEFEWPQYDPIREGPFAWNDALRTDFLAHQNISHEPQQAQKLREKGFGQVLSHRQDGISRGSGTLISLDGKHEHKSIIKDRASKHFSFSSGSSQQAYPGSLMGSIALLRQTHYDARWYRQKGHKEETHVVLEEWNNLRDKPAVFKTETPYQALRVQELGTEFDKPFIISGTSEEYQLIEDLDQFVRGFILPLDFPKAYDLRDPYDAQEVTLKQLKHWEMAPYNPSILAEGNIPFAFTASEHDNPEEFFRNIRMAIAAGLDEHQALKALTTQPAEFIDAGDKIGTLEKGKLANFLITSRPIFDEGAIIYENWVRGTPEKLREKELPSPEGDYLLTAEPFDTLRLSFQQNQVSIKADSEETEGDFNAKRNHFQLSFFHPANDQMIRLSGRITEDEGQILQGEGNIDGSEWFSWEAVKSNDNDVEEEVPEEQFIRLQDTGAITRPFRAYGTPNLPVKDRILIKNISVWTNTDRGILEEADVLIENGKIQQVEEKIEVDNVRIIDGKGRHLTPGIIDEHSHIAISGGVNESSHAITSEVRIGDVINPADINIYRQLSGGVTAAQLLHGSANPIGGQSAIIKMRWGETPKGMKFENAPPFIKFALGENVKQSHWDGDRYPQTRMGVEQIMKEGFTRAREYAELQQEQTGSGWLGRRKAEGPRRSLQLEALYEILEEERFVSCHSYVESEMTMLMNLADELGFSVNTFTHGIEAYKVADQIKEHGAGISAFTDWWNIKPELQDGIPHITSLLTWKGITTSIQSDNAELGRRLNHEAAKAVKYAGLDEEEALKLATLNPAKLLGVDDQVGQIQSGMDADVVVWDDHPLSAYAKADYTLIDGKVYFDRSEHEDKVEAINEERNRIIKKMLRAEKNGSQTQPVEEHQEHEHNCHPHDH